MNITPDNTATTWRDLADQLIPSEVEELEDLEGQIGDGERASTVMLEAARDYITYRMVDAAYADVLLPAGATTDRCVWEKNLQRDGYSRSLVWRSYGPVARIGVDVDGRQQCDGSFTRHVSLWGVDNGGELTSAQARDVAATLLEAADELDRLS